MRRKLHQFHGLAKHCHKQLCKSYKCATHHSNNCSCVERTVSQLLRDHGVYVFSTSDNTKHPVKTTIIFERHHTRYPERKTNEEEGKHNCGIIHLTSTWNVHVEEFRDNIFCFFQDSHDMNTRSKVVMKFATSAFHSVVDINRATPNMFKFWMI
mmetsp:Transcript_10327/g.19302  ORF Transcript_10327/g.19302 Transcript_10327/m.19302 type:complete len:154 (-) Transcript_10327:1143-1604(-)